MAPKDKGDPTTPPDWTVPDKQLDYTEALKQFAADIPTNHMIPAPGPGGGPGGESMTNPNFSDYLTEMQDNSRIWATGKITRPTPTGLGEGSQYQVIGRSQAAAAGNLALRLDAMADLCSGIDFGDNDTPAIDAARERLRIASGRLRDYADDMRQLQSCIDDYNNAVQRYWNQIDHAGTEDGQKLVKAIREAREQFRRAQQIIQGDVGRIPVLVVAPPPDVPAASAPPINTGAAPQTQQQQSGPPAGTVTDPVGSADIPTGITPGAPATAAPAAATPTNTSSNSADKLAQILAAGTTPASLQQAAPQQQYPGFGGQPRTNANPGGPSSPEQAAQTMTDADLAGLINAARATNGATNTPASTTPPPADDPMFTPAGLNTPTSGSPTTPAPTQPPSWLNASTAGTGTAGNPATSGPGAVNPEVTPTAGRPAASAMPMMPMVPGAPGAPGNGAGGVGPAGRPKIKNVDETMYGDDIPHVTPVMKPGPPPPPPKRT